MNQKGFTLIEILVAMLVGGMITAGVITGIFQIVYGTGQIREESVALSDIDNAAHWLTRDVVLGQSTDLDDDAPLPVSQMTLTWDDSTWWAEQEESISHSVIYTYSGTALQRNYDGVVTTVGRHLTDVGFSLDGRLVTITLTSSPEEEPRSAVTRSYTMQMRAETGL
jgi:prepilin-type N-terminal cleavage/methylation domain-containing protein